MADGLTTQTTTLATVPGSSKIATDDAGAAGHVQLVKLAIATDGDATPVPADSGGMLVNLGANNDVTGVVDLGATDNAVLDAIAASVAAADTDLTAIIGHVDGLEALLATIDADTSALFGTVAGSELQVDIVTSALPSGASTAAKQDTGNTSLGTIDTSTAAAATSLAAIDDWDNAASDGASISGDVAHDGADAGEPIKVGAKAVDYGATQTAVAANDRTNLFSDRSGVQFVLGGHPDLVTLEAAYAASAQTDTALVTVSAGTCIVVTQAQVVADEANTVGVGFRIGFGTANTPTTTGVVLTHPGIVPGSGVSRGDGSGILGIGASNEDLRITSESATSGSIRVLVSYFTIAIG